MKIQFSEPRDGEITAHLDMDLNIQGGPIYLELEINGNNPARYHFTYWDAGTTNLSKSKGRWAICGRLTNVSMDYSGKPKEKDYPIINMIGNIDNGKASLTLFRQNITSSEAKI